jgi:hypothetical protein
MKTYAFCLLRGHMQALSVYVHISVYRRLSYITDEESPNSWKDLFPNDLLQKRSAGMCFDLVRVARVPRHDNSPTIPSSSHTCYMKTFFPPFIDPLIWKMFTHFVSLLCIWSSCNDFNDQILRIYHGKKRANSLYKHQGHKTVDKCQLLFN